MDEGRHWSHRKRPAAAEDQALVAGEFHQRQNQQHQRGDAGETAHTRNDAANRQDGKSQPHASAVVSGLGSAV